MTLLGDPHVHTGIRLTVQFDPIFSPFPCPSLPPGRWSIYSIPALESLVSLGYPLKPSTRVPCAQRLMNDARLACKLSFQFHRHYRGVVCVFNVCVLVQLAHLFICISRWPLAPGINTSFSICGSSSSLHQ